MATQAQVREYALVLGSNRHAARNFRFALRGIAAVGELAACAGPLRTRDAGGGRFLNAALRVRSIRDVDALRSAMHAIEDAAGRVRGSTAVSLDIDIVASRDPSGAVQVHKPADLRRDYVRALLTCIGFP